MRVTAWVTVAVAVCTAPAAALDEVVLDNGRRYVGTIISDSPQTLVLAIDGGTVEFPRSMVVSPPLVGAVAGGGSSAATIAAESTETRPHALPGIAGALRRLRDFAWARGVRQVPALVTDRGRWQLLPCVSFWAGDFFQLSFFGDPQRPAAIEVSLIRPPTDAWEQKRQLLEYMLSLAPGLATDERFDRLDVRGDSFAVGDLWFAVTPPESSESPGRWAVLLMHETSLSASRATYAELQAISEPVPAAIIPDANQPRSWQRGRAWTTNDLMWLRHLLDADAPAPVAMETGAVVAPWTSLGGERVYAPAFTRERGRYTRHDGGDWMHELAALAAP